jgi:drug/metabolite transporter (DMT)-like permease
VAAALRIRLATLTLVAIMRATREPWPWRHWRELAGLGTLTVALPFLLYAAYAACTCPRATARCSTPWWCPWRAGLGLDEGGHSLRKWLGCACGFAGVALIVRLGPVEPSPTLLLAALACMSAAACYGVCTPWMKRATQRISLAGHCRRHPCGSAGAAGAGRSVGLAPGSSSPYPRCWPWR